MPLPISFPLSTFSVVISFPFSPSSGFSTLASTNPLRKPPFNVEFTNSILEFIVSFFMVIAFCGVSKSLHFLLRYSTFSLSSSNHANLQYFKLITNPFTPKNTLSLSPSSLHHHRQSFQPILSILLSRACDSTPFISLNKQSIHLRQSRNHSFCLFIPPSPKHTLLIDSSPS